MKFSMLITVEKYLK